METTQIETQTPTKPSKVALCHALRLFINQRSGIDGREYGGSREAFMGDYRPILLHGKHARTLLRAVELRDSITAEDLIKASEQAFSGRLTFVFKGDKVGVDYCTGQYFPTEYRNAACAVLASALWAFWRSNMPEPKTVQHGKKFKVTLNPPIGTEQTYDGLSAGDYLRRQARREFGRGIASKWFS